MEREEEAAAAAERERLGPPVKRPVGRPPGSKNKRCLLPLALKLLLQNIKVGVICQLHQLLLQTLPQSCDFKEVQP